MPFTPSWLRSPGSTLLIGALALGLPAVATAQSVSGVVVDSASGRPIEEFTIHLMNAGDRSVGSALSRAGGRFSLLAPEPGTYSLRVMRIGYRRTQTATFPLRQGEAMVRRVRVPQLPATLSAVRVDDARQCDVGISDGAGVVATVWNQVQSAVQAVRLTEGTPLTVTVRDYVRGLSPKGAVLRDSSIIRSGTSLAPYRSRSPEAIADSGYLQRDTDHVTWFAPDARVLLSDAFVATHCFRLGTDTGSRASLIGLRFTPVSAGPVTDIRGTLWVDRASSELRTLEFAYTGLPRAARDREFGGRVDFLHVPGGSWIIGSWRVQAPVFEERSRAVGASAAIALGTAPRAIVDSTVARIFEEGGDVLSARDARGTLLWAGVRSRVQGLVRDRDTGRPIGGAEVALRGTPYHAVSAVDGSYAIDSVPAGDYTLTASTSSAEPQSATIRVGVERLDVGLHLPVAAAAVAALRAQCGDARAQRERELAAVFATPLDRWAPSGPDSATQAAVIRKAPTVLLAIADTTGRVEMNTVRAVRRGPSGTYKEAMAAIALVRRPVVEPVAGCPLRQLVVLPYEVKTDR